MPRTIKRALTTALFAITVVSASATGAWAATTVNVGGGTWTYGPNHASVISHYHHPSKCHTATVRRLDSYGNVISGNSASAHPGAWASASMRNSISNVEHAYWNDAC